MKRMILPSRRLDFLQHGLEPILELAAELRARDERAHVERDEPLVLQRLGHVAAHDALRDALDDGRLADARLADEHGIVLRAAREHLHDAADLLVAADDRIDLALARSSVRSRQYFSSAWNLPSGSRSVTRCVAAHARERRQELVVARPPTARGSRSDLSRRAWPSPGRSARPTRSRPSTSRLVLRHRHQLLHPAREVRRRIRRVSAGRPSAPAPDAGAGVDVGDARLLEQGDARRRPPAPASRRARAPGKISGLPFLAARSMAS